MALKEINLIILTGLPGAGKSTYAINNFDPHETLIISYDNFKDEKNEYLPIKTIIKRHGFYHDYENIVFDGFVPDKENRIAIIYELMTEIRKQWKDYSVYNRRNDTVYFNVQEYYWYTDKDACLNNDRWRNRPKSSKRSIETWSVLLNPLTKKDWDNNLAEFFIEDKFIDTKFLYSKAYGYKEGVIEYTKKYITSDKSNPSILVGYEWNTRYDSPYEFEQLDNMLTKLCPNITFLQYKKLCRECEAKIVVDERYDDYYSNEPSIYNHWEVNIDKVHQWLIDNDLLEVN